MKDPSKHQDTSIMRWLVDSERLSLMTEQRWAILEATIHPPLLGMTTGEDEDK